MFCSVRNWTLLLGVCDLLEGHSRTIHIIIFPTVPLVGWLVTWSHFKKGTMSGLGLLESKSPIFSLHRMPFPSLLHECWGIFILSEIAGRNLMKRYFEKVIDVDFMHGKIFISRTVQVLILTLYDVSSHRPLLGQLARVGGLTLRLVLFSGCGAGVELLFLHLGQYIPIE